MQERTVQIGFSGTQLLLAALGGAVAGAAVALLTAPKSGRETRAQIKDALRDTGEKFSNAYEEGKHKVRHLPGAAKRAGSAARTAFVTAMAAEDGKA